MKYIPKECNGSERGSCDILDNIFLTTFLNCLALPKNYLAQDPFPLDAFLN